MKYGRKRKEKKKKEEHAKNKIPPISRGEFGKNQGKNQDNQKLDRRLQNAEKKEWGRVPVPGTGILKSEKLNR